MSLNYSVRAFALITSAMGAAGTSGTVQTGQGARFPTPTTARYGRIYALTDAATEIVTYTRSGDTFTFTRNVDGGGALTVASSGYVLEDLEDLGPGHTPTFDAGFFVGVGGGTWTVGAGDVQRHSWHRIGFWLEYEVVLVTTSIAGTVSGLHVLFPTVAAPTGANARGGGWPCVVFDNGTWVNAYAFWLAADTYVTIQKADGSNFAASVNNTTVAFQLRIELP